MGAERDHAGETEDDGAQRHPHDDLQQIAAAVQQRGKHNWQQDAGRRLDRYRRDECRPGAQQSRRPQRHFGRFGANVPDCPRHTTRAQQQIEAEYDTEHHQEVVVVAA